MNGRETKRSKNLPNLFAESVKLDNFTKNSKPLETGSVEQIYIATQRGYEKYCKGCESLASVEEVSRGMFSFRVHCKAGKCRKRDNVENL